MSHTPGTWKVWPEPLRSNDAQFSHQIWGPFVRVALVEEHNVGSDQAAANARLIAAAPELLEALKDLLQYGWWENAPASRTKAEAAIAKVEGRS